MGFAEAAQGSFLGLEFIPGDNVMRSIFRTKSLLRECLFSECSRKDGKLHEQDTYYHLKKKKKRLKMNTLGEK